MTTKKKATKKAAKVARKSPPKQRTAKVAGTRAPAKSSNRESASREIDAAIEALADWRAEMLSRLRALIRKAVPDVVEEVKWRKPSNAMRGVPVWSQGGILCTGETYRDKVKLTFARGASLEDPAGLFNASLEGNTRRAIDLREDDEVDARAFQSLVRAAAALNASSAPQRRG